jgi:stearoyl-CoA desaturase (delta-9 desaturase)
MGAASRDRGTDIAYPSALAFALVHLGCLGAIWTGVAWPALAVAAALYMVRMFAITAGYHRYFAHRAFRTSRAFQFVLAVLAQTSAQRGVLWWAAHHRHHHQFSDTDRDVHSPVRRGFFYAHVGWIFVPHNNDTDYAAVPDLMRFPELRWLDRHPYFPAFAMGFLVWLAMGWGGLVVGFFWSTVAVWHATFCINSLAHVAGRQRYVTGDQSRNNWALALVTFGEGWHNNHHAYQASARQGFRWWEYDFTYYALQALSWIRVVWDLRAPPAAVVRGEARLGRHVIDKVAGQLAASFPVEALASQAIEMLARAPGWLELKARVLAAKEQAEAFWSEVDLPQVPSLEEVRLYARARLAQTPSLDDIAIAVRHRLLEAMYARLREAAALPAAA